MPFAISEDPCGARVPAGPPHLAASLDIWYAWLVASRAEVDALRVMLSADERERATRFVFKRDRRRFIVARSVLRTILGRYLGCTPADVRFTYGAHGKPVLLDDARETRFNLAHSEDFAVYAVTRGRDVGVDVERVRHRFAFTEIAERFFSAAERAALQRLPPRQRARAFFRCWTRKEAYVKARGDGLTFPLADFDVSLSPDEAPRLLRVAHDPSEPSRWWMTALYPVPGYVAAAVVAGRPLRVHCAWITAAPHGEFREGMHNG